MGSGGRAQGSRVGGQGSGVHARPFVVVSQGSLLGNGDVLGAICQLLTNKCPGFLKKMTFELPPRKAVRGRQHGSAQNTTGVPRS